MRAMGIFSDHIVIDDIEYNRGEWILFEDELEMRPYMKYMKVTRVFEDGEAIPVPHFYVFGRPKELISVVKPESEADPEDAQSKKKVESSESESEVIENTTETISDTSGTADAGTLSFGDTDASISIEAVTSIADTGAVGDITTISISESSDPVEEITTSEEIPEPVPEVPKEEEVDVNEELREEAVIEEAEEISDKDVIAPSSDEEERELKDDSEIDKMKKDEE